MLNSYYFIQDFVFTTNLHLNVLHLNVGRAEFYEPGKSDMFSHKLTSI